MEIDIDKEQSCNGKYCQFMYGEALNSIYALDDTLKSPIEHLRTNIEIVKDAIERLKNAAEEANIPIKGEVRFKLNSIEDILKLRIDDKGWVAFNLIQLLQCYKGLRELFGLKTDFYVDKNKFHIGNEVWIFIKNMAVKCTIVGLDFSGLNYELDEPLGHAVSPDELASDRQEAIDAIKEQIRVLDEEMILDKDVFTEEEIEKRNCDDALNIFREENIERMKKPFRDSIEYTESVNMEVLSIIENWSNASYKTKIRIRDWFTENDVREGKVS